MKDLVLWLGPCWCCALVWVAALCGFQGWVTLGHTSVSQETLYRHVTLRVFMDMSDV